jgi:hypothetical protein
MKKILLVFFFLLITVKIFAQQFSQLNTGTLYDSFENPAQRAFIPDTSKMFASNFFLPNLNANFFVSGDAVTSLKNRAFANQYQNAALQIGKGKVNMAVVNANAYFLMLRMFTSLNGDQEMGISFQTRIEGRGSLTDETIAAFNGTQSFNDGPYSNIFNSNYYYQSYNQISFSYREKINKQLSIGFKFSTLLGVEYQKVDITSSNVTYYKAADSATVNLAGKYYAGFTPGHVSSHDYLPTFRNPGAAISLGVIYQTEDKFNIQVNVKDLGFIHWSSRSNIYNFNGTENIRGLSTPAREDSIYNQVYKIVHTDNTIGAFTTPTDGRAEVSVNKKYWIDDDHQFKYTPTLVASKELFYPGFIGGLVNPVTYSHYTGTLTFTYDDLKTFNLGLQFMYQTPNLDFFIGSDKLTQTAGIAGDAINKNSSGINAASMATGASFFIGFAYKFGPVIEHPMNASSIPMGEKGFIGRLWSRLFKTND